MSEQDNSVNDTQTDSSTDQQTQAQDQTGTSDNGTSQTQAGRTLTEEEVAFNSLSGSAQDRFRSILKEREEYREKLSRAEQAFQDRQTVEQLHSTSTQPTGTDEEVQKAVKTLKEQGGMATVDDLNALWVALENKERHDQYEESYNGSNGTPRYDRVEVEDYARRKGFGNNFLAAYREMYWDELTDAKTVSTRKPVYTEKPTSAPAQRDEPLTLDSFRKNLRGPNAQAYYEKVSKNPSEFTALLAQLTEE